VDVFIIRLKDNVELITYIEGIHDNKVKAISPHYIKYFADSHSLGIMPYCPLSDEVHFDIDISRVEFMVLPKKEIKRRYIRMLMDECEGEDCLTVEGNQTQH